MRLDRRTFLGSGLALAAALAAFIATRPPPTEPVLIAARPLAAGAPLSPGDLTVRHVGTAEGMVDGSDLSTFDGWAVITPLDTGEPLLRSLLRSPQRQAAPDVISIAVAIESAAGGSLRSGDLVDVYLTAGPDTEETATTERVARSVPVVDVLTTEGFGGGGVVSILLAVDQALAAVLANASHAGDVDLVRLGR